MAGEPVRGAGRVPPATAITEKRRPLIVLRPFSRWRIRASAVVSVLIHATVFALLLLTIQRQEIPEEVPPATVALVFESGKKESPSTPNPTVKSPSVAPKAESQSTQPPSPTPEQPPAPTASATPSPEAAPAPAAPPPGPETREAPQPPVTPPAPAPPRVEIPPPPAETVPTPQIVPEAPPVIPVPQAPEPLPLPPPAPPQPLPRPEPRPAPPAQQQVIRPKPPAGSSGFPAPMNYSFGGPAARAPSQSRPGSHSARTPMSIDMSLGPAIRGALKNTQKGANDSDNPDWMNLVTAWVRRHAYYPPQAARNNEEGDSTVHVEADHFGHVKSVELIGKSGSVWLDMALVAMFRDAHIPALPTPGDDPIDLTFTIHYILLPPSGY